MDATAESEVLIRQLVSTAGHFFRIIRVELSKSLSADHYQHSQEPAYWMQSNEHSERCETMYAFEAIIHLLLLRCQFTS